MRLQDMYPAVLSLVLIGVVLGVGLYILDSVENNLTGAANTALNTTISGLGGFASWIAIIVVVIAASIVLGVVLSSFGGNTPGI